MTDRFVVDSSVVMSWCFQDETSEYTESVLEELSESTAIVPSIWPLEIVNVLLVAERRGRLKPVDSVRFITLLSKLPIAVDYHRPDREMKDLLTLGRSCNLSSYDAAYLDLAIRKGCPIATQDKKLLKAAKQLELPIQGTRA